MRITRPVGLWAQHPVTSPDFRISVPQQRRPVSGVCQQGGSIGEVDS